MNLKEFNELKEKIENRDFNKNYKNINRTLYYLSYFGNLVSIFLAFFILSKILATAIESIAAVYIISLILLTGLELLKRDVFDKFSIQIIKDKMLKKSAGLLLFFSLIISTTSFIATISGAKELSSKQKVYTTQQEEKTDTYADSLTAVYNAKITEFEKEKKDNKSKIDEKDNEQTQLASITEINRQQAKRISDLKAEISQLRSDNDNIDTNINRTKTELNTKIQQYNEKIGNETNNKKKENKTNIIVFVLISTLVEFTILIGVFFNEYYRFKSYKEYKDKIDKDPLFQQWIMYERLLNIIYNDDTKINDKIISSKNILDICKVNGLIILPKELNNFFKLLHNLGIIRTSGSIRYFIKSKETALELLRKQFEVK